ncbi:MAG: hypothetical protein ABIJ26_00295, partial [Candidatus Margulisiibacteriota bacterium]
MTVQQLRDAGFGDNEIRDYTRTKLGQAGFQENEIQGYLEKGGLAETKPSLEPFSLGRLGTQAWRSVGLGGRDILQSAQSILEAGGRLPPTEERRGPFVLPKEEEQRRKTEVEAERQKIIGGLKTGQEAYPELLPGTSGMIESATTGVSRFMPAMLGTAINLPAGLALTFASIQGNKYKEYIDKGHDPDKSFASSVISAAAQTPVEFAGNVLQLGWLKHLAKGAGVPASKFLSNRFTQFVTFLVKQGATEGAEEFIQKYPEAIVDTYMEHQDKTAAEIVGILRSNLGQITKEAGQEAIIGGLGGVMLGAPFGMAHLAQPAAPEQKEAPPSPIIPLEGISPKAQREIRNRIVSSPSFKDLPINLRANVIKDFQDFIGQPSLIKEGITEADLLNQFKGKQISEAVASRRNGEIDSIFADFIEPSEPISIKPTPRLLAPVPEFPMERVPQPRRPVAGPEGQWVEGAGPEFPYGPQRRLPGPVPMLPGPKPGEPLRRAPSGPVIPGIVGGGQTFFPEGAPIQMGYTPEAAAPVPEQITPEFQPPI